MASREQRELAHQRRQRISELLLQRIPAYRIAEMLGVSTVTVFKHKRELERIWQRELAEDYITLRTRELAELDEMERECILKQNQASVLGLTPDDIAQMGSSKLAALLADEGAWFDRRLKVKERRSKLLGLDKVQLRQNEAGDGNGGGAVTNNDNRQVLIYVEGPQQQAKPVQFVDWLKGALNSGQPTSEIVEGIAKGDADVD